MGVENFIVRLIIVLLVGPALLQYPASDVKHDERIPTIEEALRRHHIQLTKPAIVEALRNADSTVRSLAAQKLAQDKATETVPAILEALTAEDTAPTRVHIAFALAQLGELKGFNALEHSCQDRSLPTWLRIDAARYVIYFLRREGEPCRKALLEILRSQPGGDSLMGAASLLRLFRDLSDKELQTIIQAAVGALAGPEPSQRLAAAITLGEIGDGSAIPHLQRAAARERDETVRLRMREELQRLQRKRDQ